MGSLYELAICLIFIGAGIFSIYKIVIEFNRHSVEVWADVIESSEVTIYKNHTIEILAEYCYKSQEYKVPFATSLFKKPKKGDKIKIRISPQKPNDVVYYGKDNKFYYISLIFSSFITGILTIYFFYWILKL